MALVVLEAPAVQEAPVERVVQEVPAVPVVLVEHVSTVSYLVVSSHIALEPLHHGSFSCCNFSRSTRTRIILHLFLRLFSFSSKLKRSHSPATPFQVAS